MFKNCVNYLFVILLTTPAIVWSYSSGAPKDACIDLVPQHHTAPQNSPAPYNLQASKLNVKTDDTVRLTLKGNSGQNTIKGFLVQARIGNKPVGQFIPGPNSQTLDCSGPKDSITHTKIQDNGEKQIVFDWKPPTDIKGPVSFVGTVAQDGGTFWVGKVTQGVNIV